MTAECQRLNLIKLLHLSVVWMIFTPTEGSNLNLSPIKQTLNSYIMTDSCLHGEHLESSLSSSTGRDQCCYNIVSTINQQLLARTFFSWHTCSGVALTREQFLDIQHHLEVVRFLFSLAVELLDGLITRFSLHEYKDGAQHNVTRASYPAHQTIRCALNFPESG